MGEARLPRVLFIDDEEQLLRSYRRLLRNLDVSVAAGGRAGIDALARDQDWDAVFCDISMPEVDGADVWAWIEASFPHLCARVVFVTGGAFTSRGATFVKAHQDRLLEKPVARPQLEAAAKRLMVECDRARAPAAGGLVRDRDDRG